MITKQLTWSELRIKQDLFFSHLRNKFIKDSKTLDCNIFDVDSWRSFKKNNSITNYRRAISQGRYNENKDTIIFLNPFYGWHSSEKYPYIEIPYKVVEKLIGKEYLLVSFRTK